MTSLGCLILYATHQDNANVQYFINQGLPSILRSSNVTIVFILNDEKLALANLPSHPKIKIVHRANVGFDFAAWSIGLQMVNLAHYHYFLFLNSTVRGPMFPLWTPSSIVNRWWEIFFQRLSSVVKLVGTTINLHMLVTKPIDDSPCQPHIQSMVLATDRIGLKIAQERNIFGNYIRDRNETIQHCEIGWSTAILQSNYNIGCLLKAYEHCDFRVLSNALKRRVYASFPRRNGVGMWCGDHLRANCYFGSNIHPYEVVFMKTNRDISPSTLACLGALPNPTKKAR